METWKDIHGYEGLYQVVTEAIRLNLLVYKKGSDSCNAKLDPLEIKEIRNNISASQRALARTYNVSQRAIWNIKNNKTYTIV